MSTIDLRDPTTATVIIGGIAATMFFFCYVLVGNFRESKRTHEWINLHQPLHPSAIDLRLDAALRDAQEGFNVCDACNFENLKRNIFCTICGSPIDTSKKKRKDKLHAQRRLASANDNRRRQARALKRKEWARRLTSDGKLVWFLDGSQPGPEDIEKGIESRSYVLQFQGEPLAKEEVVEKSPGGGLRDGSTPDHVSLTIDDDVGEQSDGHTAHQSGTASAGGATPVNQVHSSGNMDQSPNDTNPDAADPQNDEKEAKRRPRIVLQTLEQTSRQLSDEIASHPSILLSSTSADPQRPAVVIKAESEFHEEPKLLVEHSQLNFPSKIADFVTRTSTALMLSDQSFLKLKIRRDNLLQDSIEALAATPASCSRSPLRMTFVGEQGIDAGGVYREWLVLVSEQLVSREACIFKCVDSKDQAYYLNPTSGRDIGEYHLAHYFATGRLLGRVLLEGNTTGFHLALPLLKIIVGQPVTFSDLEFFDPEAYKSLRWVLNHNGVDALGLDFTTTEVTSKGEHVVVELVPGGQSIDVTDANKHEYVECKLKYLLFDSVASQLFAFLKGLYEVMPPELLMLFDAEELDYVLSGSDEIDVDDWERNSKYTADLIEHPVREWFWDLVREMPNEYRRRLLLFSTGSSRVPLAGFGSLTSYDGRLCPFMLKGVDMAESGDYIHSHACFNRLDLPRYGKKKDLKAVLYGILDTDMYGFTTA